MIAITLDCLNDSGKVRSYSSLISSLLTYSFYSFLVITAAINCLVVVPYLFSEWLLLQFIAVMTLLWIAHLSAYHYNQTRSISPRAGHGVGRSHLWCDPCQSFRPLAGEHCRLCGCCVVGIDQHCSWFGNCIGAHNYRHYAAHLLLTAVYCSVASIVTGIPTLRALLETDFLPTLCNLSLLSWVYDDCEDSTTFFAILLFPCLISSVAMLITIFLNIGFFVLFLTSVVPELYDESSISLDDGFLSAFRQNVIGHLLQQRGIGGVKWRKLANMFLFARRQAPCIEIFTCEKDEDYDE